MVIGRTFQKEVGAVTDSWGWQQRLHKKLTRLFLAFSFWPLDLFLLLPPKSYRQRT